LLVSPVVKLLRVNKSVVFQDSDAIQPGKRWQGEIAKVLAESISLLFSGALTLADRMKVKRMARSH
jgi:hypothetical protein